MVLRVRRNRPEQEQEIDDEIKKLTLDVAADPGATAAYARNRPARIAATPPIRTSVLLRTA